MELIQIIRAHQTDPCIKKCKRAIREHIREHPFAGDMDLCDLKQLTKTVREIMQRDTGFFTQEDLETLYGYNKEGIEQLALGNHPPIRRWLRMRAHLYKDAAEIAERIYDRNGAFEWAERWLEDAEIASELTAVEQPDFSACTAITASCAAMALFYDTNELSYEIRGLEFPSEIALKQRDEQAQQFVNYGLIFTWKQYLEECDPVYLAIHDRFIDIAISRKLNNSRMLSRAYREEGLWDYSASVARRAHTTGLITAHQLACELNDAFRCSGNPEYLIEAQRVYAKSGETSYATKLADYSSRIKRPDWASLL